LRTGTHALIRATSDIAVDADETARAEPIAFATAGGRLAHAYFYAPANREFEGPADERPPLLVIDHGGPTGATSSTFRWGIQYWTQRGFAVVDVDYGGSTGYGRAYRERCVEAGASSTSKTRSMRRATCRTRRVDPKRVASAARARAATTLAALTLRTS
jgi:dipeptidyl aminopeptidase/acylaminoacyl peptidase